MGNAESRSEYGRWASLAGYRRGGRGGARGGSRGEEGEDEKLEKYSDLVRTTESRPTFVTFGVGDRRPVGGSGSSVL